MNEKELIKCVELQLGRKGVKMEDRFFEDLEIVSIDMVFILTAIESSTGLFIPEEVIPDLKTVQELHHYINSNLSQ